MGPAWKPYRAHDDAYDALEWLNAMAIQGGLEPYCGSASHDVDYVQSLGLDQAQDVVDAWERALAKMEAGA